MKHSRIISLLTTVAAIMIFAAIAWADDLTIIGLISGPQTYDSPEGIVFDDTVLDNTANVVATSTYEVHLNPGTWIQTGARLAITIRDNDGLSNRCEMQYFGDLSHSPDSDDDGDQLTNYQECVLGYNPNENDPDNDEDGLPDWWEVQNFGIDLSQNRNDDTDNDGISNWVEYKLGTNPNVANEKGPGLHYEYDELGRIKKIQRIPSH